jgi:two-component sensor histidine kinase
MGHLGSSEQTPLALTGEQSFRALQAGEPADLTLLSGTQPLDLSSKHQPEADRLLSLARVLFNEPDMQVWLVEERTKCDLGVHNPLLGSGRTLGPFCFQASTALFAREGDEVGRLWVASPKARPPAETLADQSRMEVLAGVAADMMDMRRRLHDATEALAEKELLVREADHRVANGLQLLYSALTLQASREPDAPSRAAIRAAALRVSAVAGAHRHLHKAPERRMDGGALDVSAYLSTLLRDVGQRLEIEGDAPGTVGSSVLLDVEPDAALAVPAGLLPRLGLIAAELVANALKHGTGPVLVALRAVPEGGSGVVLAVSDQGPGFPPGFDPAAGSSQGLGMRLVVALSRPGRVAIDRDNPSRITVLLLERAASSAKGTN